MVPRKNLRLLFLGHNGYEYPHTRVRCYHFARILSEYPDVETAVLSFRDDLAPHKTEAAMYENLRDREKLLLTGKAVWRLLRERNTVIYIQKAHFHSAAPYWLYRLGWINNYLFDYDDYDIPLSNFFFRGVLNRFFFGSNRWDEITWRMARNARGCIAASRELESLLLSKNPHTAYIPTGVDTTVFTPKPCYSSRSETIVLWNGLVWGKPIVENLAMLFRACQRARIQASDLSLRLVGGGAAWPEIKKIAAEQFPGLPIRWMDWIDPTAMPSILHDVDAGVLPLHGDDPWLRCKSPTKLFEYMAAGLPVIASAIGEATHVIQHDRSGILAQTEDEFSAALIRLTKDTDCRKSIGMQARQRVVSEYALPVLGERLYHFLQTLFSKSFMRNA